MNLKTNLRAAATLLVAVALLFTASCTKDTDSPAAPDIQKAEIKAVTDKGLQKEIKESALAHAPIAWYNQTMDKVIVYNPLDKSKSFSFSDPSDGWTFATNQGVVWTQSPAGGGVWFITPGSFGSGGSGGVVSAGNLTLPIDFTLCFTADESAFGFDPDEFGDFSGLSGVIGIAGNVQALENEDFESDEVEIENFFLGVAVYVVFEDQASGSYPVFDFVDEDVDLDNLDDDNVLGKAFSIVIGFDKNYGGIYMSNGGTMSVSGGTMSFNGTYFGYEVNFGDLLDDPDPDDFITEEYVEVSGSGSMGC